MSLCPEPGYAPALHPGPYTRSMGGHSHTSSVRSPAQPCTRRPDRSHLSIIASASARHTCHLLRLRTPLQHISGMLSGVRAAGALPQAAQARPVARAALPSCCNRIQPSCSIRQLSSTRRQGLPAKLLGAQPTTWATHRNGRHALGLSVLPVSHEQIC